MLTTIRLHLYKRNLSEKESKDVAHFQRMKTGTMMHREQKHVLRLWRTYHLIKQYALLIIKQYEIPKAQSR